MPNQLLHNMKKVELTLHSGNVISCYICRFKQGDHYPDLPEADRVISIKTIKEDGEKEILQYLPIYAGFDIETTNVIDGDDKSGYMYHWQVGIANEKWGIIFLGREWSGYFDILSHIRATYNLGLDRRLILWDANLGFEFSFINKRHSWIVERFFAKEEKHPLNAPTVDGFDYRECLSISGGSLEQLAKDYTTTQKLVGDLDYDVLRSSETPLTEEEENYCINDVAILIEWSSFIFDKYIKPDKKIPLTKTGLLRSEMKQELKNTCTYQQRQDYKNLVYNAHPDLEHYKFLFRWVFRGGYNHGNIKNCGYKIEGADGYDITSSYPAQMNIGYYPTTPFEPIYDYNLEELINTKCAIMICEFHELKRKYSISYESKHKCIEIADSEKTKILIDNGRVAEAGVCVVALTEIDYKIYKKLYKWDESNFKIKAIWIAERGRLPQFVLNTLNRHYKAKAQMKKAGLKDTPEYAIEKSGVNAGYGLLVTRIQMDKITINANGEWVTIEDSVDFEKERKKAFLLPQWGVWCTAHARMALFMPMFAILEDNELGDWFIIYNDTDSIKTRKHPKIQTIIDKYNVWVSRKIKLSGLTEPEFDDLGQYEHEAVYEFIKVLGSKRYLTQEGGKIKATIAGMPKKALLNIKGDAFEAFSEYGMKLEAQYSEKRTIHYEPNPTIWIAPDGVVMKELSSACIYDIPFSMKLDGFYKKLIEDSIKENARKKLGGNV